MWYLVLLIGLRSDSYFRVEGLKAYYGDSYIVQDVSFSVNEGEIVALLGRNGAGKTSTLRAIAISWFQRTDALFLD